MELHYRQAYPKKQGVSWPYYPWEKPQGKLEIEEEGACSQGRLGGDDEHTSTLGFSGNLRKSPKKPWPRCKELSAV